MEIKSIIKARLIISMLSIFVFLILISLVQANQTNLTETPIAPSTSTIIPGVISPTASPINIKESKFRVGPTIKIKPLNNNITKSADGVIELFMNNPSLNDVTLNLDVRISAPSSIHVYGSGFSEVGAAGTVYGTFDVTPGSGRIISIILKAENTGDFNINFNGLYWPDDNKDAYNPVSQAISIKVFEPSSKPNVPEPSNPEQVGVHELPYTWIILAAVVLGGIGLILALGRRPPKSEINIE